MSEYNQSLFGNNQQQAHVSDDLVGTVRIKVVGCGGAGTNMSNWLYRKGVKGAEIIACNTDLLHLNTISADRKLLLGQKLTKGLGCGGYPEKGEQAAQETVNQLREVLVNSDMIFICAGMGGGTGTGSAHVVAKIAKEFGSIVIGTVTMPFTLERSRIDKAYVGLDKLRQSCDTVVVIDNNRLVQIAGNLPVAQAFAVANELIATMIRGIVEIIAVPSLVNLDYADVKAIMTNGGVASIGVGSSDTDNRVEEAVRGALSNPLLDIKYDGSTGALIHVEGGPDMTLEEVNRVGELVTEAMDQDANVIWGARISENMKGKITVMTIVTGVKSSYLLGSQSSHKNRNVVREEDSFLEDELQIKVLR